MAFKWVIDTQQFVFAVFSLCKPFGNIEGKALNIRQQQEAMT